MTAVDPGAHTRQREPAHGDRSAQTIRALLAAMQPEPRPAPQPEPRTDDEEWR